ncbi:MAG: HAMP domain-containing histidine kinase [Blautia sp.]|nr:HAMP domain-containing histidine kinase [Blautia sp.]
MDKGEGKDKDIGRGRMGLWQKLFIAIILFSLSVIILSGAITAAGIHRMADEMVQSNESLNGEFLPVLRSGFSQTELSYWKLLIEIAKEVASEEITDPDLLLSAIKDRWKNVFILEGAFAFLVKDGTILSACTGRDGVFLSNEEMTEALGEIEADPVSYGLVWELEPEFHGIMSRVRKDNGVLMAFSKEKGKDQLLLIYPLTEDMQLGILTKDTTAVRWMEVLYELQERSAQNAKEQARKETNRMLFALTLGIVLLAFLQSLLAFRLTRFLADPIEREREERERQLIISEKEKSELLEIDRLKTESLANISHELKTPLTVVSTYVEECQTLLLSGADEAKLGRIDQNMKIVVAEANRLALMVSQVIDIAALEEGRMKLYLQKNSLLQLIQEVLNTYYPVLSIHGNSLMLQRGSTVPMVVCDAARIRQVLINILNNAAQHTQQGKITIRLLQTPEGVRCEVSDTGGGIAEESLPHIFERYYTQKEKTDDGRNTGIGLGLFISNRIIRAHGGQMGAESTPGEGTTIWFTIPEKSAPLETDTSSPA